MPVRSSQVAARTNRLIGPYRAMSRSRASKVLARPPRSRNSTRMPENTHLVIRTGIARGTTRVMIADSTVVTTISAPATKAIHASTVVPTASLPPLPAPLVAATAPPAPWPPPGPSAAPTPGSRPPRPGAPPGPAAAPTTPAAPGRARRWRGCQPRPAPPAPWKPAQVSGIPQPPPRRPRRYAPRPLVHPRIIPPPLGSPPRSCLQCSSPRQPAWEIGRHRLVWSMAPAC